MEVSMKERCKRLLSLSVFVFLIFSGIFGLLAEKPPVEVVQAARAGICDFMNAGTSSGNFPASAKASSDNTVIGHGFQIYTVPPAALAVSSELTPIIAPTALWRFVVMANGKPVSLVTVAQVQGNWTAVSMGGAQLAPEVNAVMEQWPAAKGYAYRFIRVYQARADFIEISMNGKLIGFVPLTASRLAFGLEGPFDAGALLQSSEIVVPLRRLVNEKMPELTKKS
jgi:hypothetical protein